jgi:membrane protein implicated in regulation of membrane protease activity
MVERFRNGLNVVRGTGGVMLFGVIAVAAVSAGGWQGWLIGFVFLSLAVYALIWPWKWPKYRPPET